MKESKGNIINPMILMKHYIVKHLKDILLLLRQYHYLNNNERIKNKPFKFNANNEALYCNEFERYFAPSSPILLSE